MSIPAPASNQATPAAMPDDGSEGAEQIVITITAAGDGTFTVSMGGDSDDSQDEQSGDQPQTASSIDDACKIAKEMYMAESGEESAETEDDSQDGNATLSPTDAKAAWKQMAAKKAKGGM